MPEHTNSLINATSPYLLQHAHNPVDWKQWGEAAFAEARDRGVPIFLSIGYSTCYWCHVMERESFESEATAKVMNDRFVCVKLDREERPDVDDVYMVATQAMTGRGGWPMSVFLEPDSLRPFYCGTYFPPEPRSGLPSFEQVLLGMSDAFAQKRGDVVRQAEAVAEAVHEQFAARERPVVVGAEQVQQAVATILKIADMQQGGFGAAPKFPQPAYIDFLLAVRDASDASTRSAIDRVLTLTLDEMLKGGIHDHVGGGFHRYAVDATWTVPHFEKMLYDNGQLAATYAIAARVFGSPEYLRVATRCADYVLREMTHPEGGFYSAQDAEVDHREGLNYLWTPEEIRAVLDEDDATFAIDRFGLDVGPNFRDPHHPDDPPTNVLRLDKPPRDDADRLDRIAADLLRARDKRKQPGLDDKVLVSWNGTMIRGLAELAVSTGDQRYRIAAERAAAFIDAHLVDESGMLYRSWRGTRGDSQAFLEDYANLVVGLCALARATRHAEADAGSFVSQASTLAERAVSLFVDSQSGAFFDTSHDATPLFVRGRSTYDGAMPSGVATMLQGLLDLADLDPAGNHADHALRAIVAHSAAIHASPIATVHSTHALFRVLSGGLPIEAALSDAHAAEPEPADDAAGETPQPVEIYAGVERLSVSAETPGELTVLVRIDEGFHVIAAEPGGPDGLLPFRVAIVGGSGVAAYADYPSGAPIEVPGETQPVMAYEGSFEMTIALERTEAERQGRPILVVTYQACSETECLVPQTVELDVAIDLE
ncbi:MAG: thioredoxin domain-containing protein [Planctomycetota bacterium]